MSEEKEISVIENEGDEILLKVDKTGIKITKKIAGEIDEMYIGKSGDFVVDYISKSLVTTFSRKSLDHLTQ